MNSVNYLEFQDFTTGRTVTLSPQNSHYFTSLQQIIDHAPIYDGNPSYDPLLMIDTSAISSKYQCIIFNHQGKFFKSHLSLNTLIEFICQAIDLKLDNWNRYWNMVLGSHRFNYPVLAENDVVIPFSNQMWINLRSANKFTRIQDLNYLLILSPCESVQLMINLDLEEDLKQCLKFAGNLAFDHFMLGIYQYFPIINDYILSGFINYYFNHNIFHPLVNLASFTLPPQKLHEYIEWQKLCRIMDGIQNPIFSQKLMDQLIHIKDPSALTNLRVLEHEKHILSSIKET